VNINHPNLYQRSRPKKPKNSLEMAKLATAALAQKTNNTIILQVTALTSYTDYFLLASGRSPRHVTAIAKHVQQTFKKAGIKIIGADGIKNGQWALIDLGNIVVHIFYKPIRDLYDLESLWIDAPRITLKKTMLPIIPKPNPISEKIKQYQKL